MLSPIQEALAQNKPFASAAHEAAVGLILAADILRRRLGRAVEPFGVTGQQYNVLRILRGGGKDGLPTLTIAERMIEQTPGITRLLDRLEEKGLVRRERCASDRRQVLCWITPTGLKLLEAMDDVVREVDRSSVGTLRPADQKELVRLLGRIVASGAEP
jgi:MarR family transcriptional regulator, organic hydroperoxide resistance regulator